MKKVIKDPCFLGFKDEQTQSNKIKIIALPGGVYLQGIQSRCSFSDKHVQWELSTCRVQR